MPQALTYGSIVATSDGTLFYVGGFDGSGRSKSILELKCPADGGGKNALFSLVCAWSPMKQTLKVGRSAFVAMLVPKSYYNC